MLNLSLLALSILSCNNDKEEQRVPSFIHIEDIKLETENGEGSSSNDIKDAWVFIDDNLQGTFELPADVPVLQKGEVNVKVRPGIKNNGQIEQRKRYPYYNRYDTTITLYPDSSVNVYPKVGYFRNVNFWIEDFEDISNDFVKNQNSDTNLVRVQDDRYVFEGEASGGVFLNGVNKILASIRTNNDFNLPADQSVYLEMDFNIDGTMGVGLIEDDGSNFDKKTFIVLKPTDNEWKKIYLDLNSLIVKDQGVDFEVFFEIQNNEEKKKTYLLDNVKLLY